MLKKTITYTNFLDETVTEDFYFNLTKAEMMEMSVGGYEAVLQKMLDTQDMKEILRVIKELLGAAVGKRSEDGKRFIKNQEITDEFLQSEAFSELFMELLQDEGTKSQEFFMGLMPKGLGEKAQATILPVNPPKIQDIELPSEKDPKDMTKEELLEAFRKKSQG